MLQPPQRLDGLCNVEVPPLLAPESDDDRMAAARQLLESSGCSDIRPLVVKTLLTYLELDNVIHSTGPFYSGLKFQPEKTSQEIRPKSPLSLVQMEQRWELARMCRSRPSTSKACG